MKTVAVEHRDVYITLEFPIDQIRYLKGLLDLAEITYESGDQFMQEATAWMHEELEPKLKKFTDAFGERDGGTRDDQRSES